MSIEIIKPGILSTLQDTGRQGFRYMGVGPGGAADPFASRVANYLTGNEEQAAVLEMSYPAAEILFLQDTLIAVTGAEQTVTLDDQPVILWKPLLAKKDSVMVFSKPVYGAWTYLAVAGGWKSSTWLDSHSTQLQAGAGGYHGRPLQWGDKLECREEHFLTVSSITGNARVSPVELELVYQPANIIRCMSSVEWERVDEPSMNRFFSETFIMSTQSNRMGYRFNGLPLSMKGGEELLSSPVDTGTIQLLPDGNIIILMADHQTTGGYPRIASVIRPDIPKLAQVRPGEQVRFMPVTPMEAETALLSYEQRLTEIKHGCHLNFGKIHQR